MRQIFPSLACLISLVCLGCQIDPKQDWHDFQFKAAPAYTQLARAQPTWTRVQTISAGRETRATIQEVRRLLHDELLPCYDRAILALETTHPRSAEVKQARTHYLQGLQNYQKGVQLMVLGLDTRDEAKVNESMRLTAEGLRIMGLAKQDADGLNRKYGQAQAPAP